MAKRCIICKEEAKYVIKGTSDFYCDECAHENFDDLECLEKIEKVDQEKKKEKLMKEEEQKIEETVPKDTDTDTDSE